MFFFLGGGGLLLDRSYLLRMGCCPFICFILLCFHRYDVSAMWSVLKIDGKQHCLAADSVSAPFFLLNCLFTMLNVKEVSESVSQVFWGFFLFVVDVVLFCFC